MFDRRNQRSRRFLLVLFAVVLLQTTAWAAPATISQTAARQYKAAESLVIEGKHQTALKLVQETVTDHPHSGTYVEGHFTEPYYPYFLLGWIHMENADPEQALAAFDLELAEGAIQKDLPRFRELTLRRELILCRMNNTDSQP